MAVQRQPGWYFTVDEWRELERTSQIKHEYRDGHLYAMSGGTVDHGRLGCKTVRMLEDALAGSSCEVSTSDVAVRLSANRYVYPDVAVTCDKRDQVGNNKELHFAVIVVEVLSNSTEIDDRGEKSMYYQACPSIQEYVMINTRFQRVEVYRRAPETWSCQMYRPGEEVELISLDIRFPVDFLYTNTDVPLLSGAKGKRRRLREESI